jgi:hypothetical protein
MSETRRSGESFRRVRQCGLDYIKCIEAAIIALHVSAKNAYRSQLYLYV